MSAAYLAKALGASTKITVLEAPTIPRIGVGEATIPNLQKVFFDVLGLLPEHDGVPLSHYWTYKRLRGETDEPFDRACYPQPAVFDAKLSPRYLDGTKWASYAWHFDAQLVADSLRRHATKKLSVVHVEDRFTTAEIHPNGHITAITTEAGRRLEDDLFIDCSGTHVGDQRGADRQLHDDLHAARREPPDPYPVLGLLPRGGRGLRRRRGTAHPGEPSTMPSAGDLLMLLAALTRTGYVVAVHRVAANRRADDAALTFVQVSAVTR